MKYFNRNIYKLYFYYDFIVKEEGKMRKNEKIEALVIFNIILYNAILIITPIYKGSQEKDDIHSNDGLVSHWTFDDMGDIAHDISGNGNEATIFGAEYITDTPMGSGFSLKFRRSDKDYISTPIYQMPVQSISLWFKW